MQKTGRVTIKVDGDAYASAPGASIQLGGVTRESGMTDQGSPWYQESLIPSEFKATLVHIAELDLPAIRQITDAVATYECDNGITYSARNVHFKSMGELANGEVEVTFGGAPAEQV